MATPSTGRPVHAALDLLGRRWAPRVLWELRDGEPAGFRELRERCDAMSTSVLRARLVELLDSGIVEQVAPGYRLSRLGASLVEVLAPLDGWARRWDRATTPRPRRGPASR